MVWHNVVAFLAFVSLALFHALLPSRFARPSIGLFAASIVLLLVSGNYEYVKLAMVISVLAGCSFVGFKTRDCSPFVGFLFKVSLCLYHLCAMWLLPVRIFYEWIWAHSEKFDINPNAGHIVASTVFIFVLLNVPIMILPKGYEKATLLHQRYDCIYNATIVCSYSLLWRWFNHAVFHFDPPFEHHQTWHHEGLVALWASGYLAGTFCSFSNIHTQAYVAFPAISHGYFLYHHNQRVTDEEWEDTWITIHQVHGMLFVAGGVCRLLCRVPESMWFFYVTCFVFMFGPRPVTQGVVEILFDESNTYPKAHIVIMVAVILGSLLFGIYIGTATRLRVFMDQTFGTNENEIEFSPLASSEKEALKTHESFEGDNDWSLPEEKSDKHEFSNMM